MATRKFGKKKSALNFCTMVNGRLIDVKEMKLQADCKYIVSYTGTRQLPKEERKLRRKLFYNRNERDYDYDNYLAEKQISGDFSDFD